MADTSKFILSFKYYGEHTNKLYELFGWSRRLYNQALYHVISEYSKTQKWLNYYDLDKLLKDECDIDGNIPYRKLPACMAQEVLKQVDGAIKSMRTKYKKKLKHATDKSHIKIEWPKYQHRPNKIRIPRLSTKWLAQGKLLISHKLRITINIPYSQWSHYKNILLEHTRMLEILPSNSGVMINIVYELETPKPKENGNLASGDIGCYNLISIATNQGDSILVDGREVIRENKMWQKKRAHYQKILMLSNKKKKKKLKLNSDQKRILNDNLPYLQQAYMKNGIDCMSLQDQDGFIRHILELVHLNVDVTNKKAFIIKLLSALKENKTQYTSKRIRNIDKNHNNWIKNMCHQTTKHIVDVLKSKNVCTIVVGYNKGWKKSIRLGTKTNQMMGYIPFNVFIRMLEYKCKKAGIIFVLHEESYTSKSDALALEPICKHNTYSGKRIERGLFISSTGILINADINGALNIGRKIYGDDYAVQWLHSPAGNGYGSNPIRHCVHTVKVRCKKCCLNKKSGSHGGSRVKT